MVITTSLKDNRNLPYTSFTLRADVTQSGVEFDNKVGEFYWEGTQYHFNDIGIVSIKDAEIFCKKILAEIKKLKSSCSTIG